MSIKVKTYDNVRIKFYSAVTNPVGKDYFVVPNTQYKRGEFTTISVINGAFTTSNWVAKGVAFDGTSMMIIFDRAISVPIRINYAVIEQL